MLRFPVREERAEGRDAAFVAGGADTVHDDVGFETGFVVVDGMATER
jgi:hypothetical protein